MVVYFVVNGDKAPISVVLNDPSQWMLIKHNNAYFDDTGWDEKLWKRNLHL